MGKYESPSFSHLWIKVREIMGQYRDTFCSFWCHFPIIYITFYLEDIRCEVAVKLQSH